MYGSESRIAYKKDEKKINTVKMRSLRNMSGNTKKVRNKEIKKECVVKEQWDT